MKRATGTREWAAHSVNCLAGCEHDCRYCYARATAVRFNRVSRQAWHEPRVLEEQVQRGRGRMRGRVMFPTTHDITPRFLEPCLTVLRKLLEAGNEVLVVSKPHRECIAAICDMASPYRDQLTFRFTIGAVSDRILSWWEPGAPRFSERLVCLGLAKSWGFQTSVSAEPCLDFERVDELIARCLPLVTDSIWIGKMNHAKRRVRPRNDEEREAVALLEHEQRDGVIHALYQRWCEEPKVKWKDSIKRVVGLPLVDEIGADT